MISKPDNKTARRIARILDISSAHPFLCLRSEHVSIQRPLMQMKGLGAASLAPCRASLAWISKSDTSNASAPAYALTGGARRLARCRLHISLHGGSNSLLHLQTSVALLTGRDNGAESLICIKSQNSLLCGTVWAQGWRIIINNGYSRLLL